MKKLNIYIYNDKRLVLEALCLLIKNVREEIDYLMVKTP